MAAGTATAKSLPATRAEAAVPLALECLGNLIIRPLPAKTPLFYGFINIHKINTPKSVSYL